MANVPLKSITFPGLTDTYTVPQIDANLTASGKAADAKAVGDAIDDFLEVAATASSNDVHILVSPTSSTIDLATQDEVDELRNDLDDTNKAVFDYTVPDINWVIGGITSTGGLNSSYKWCIRPYNRAWEVPLSGKIGCDNGYEIRIVKYNSVMPGTSTFVSDSGWSAAPLSVSEGEFIAPMIRYAGDTSTVLTDTSISEHIIYDIKASKLDGLQDEINSNASAIDDIENALRNHIVPTISWVIGGITSTGGLNSSQTWCIRPYNRTWFAPVDGAIGCDNGYEVRVVKYTGEIPGTSTFVSDSGWSATPIQVSQGEYIAPMIRYAGDTSTVLTDTSISEHIIYDFYEYASINYSTSPYYRNIDSKRADFSNWYETSQTFTDGFDRDTLYTTVISAFDALMTSSGGYLTKSDLGGIGATDLNGAEYHLYEYTFAAKKYNSGDRITPVFLLNCTAHGFEKNAAYATYYFIKDLLQNWQNSPALTALRSNVIIKFIPVQNPWGFDRNDRLNENGVNLNRNYWNPQWTSGESGTSDYGGVEPFDQPESAITRDWILNNKNAFAVLDVHTNGQYNSPEWGGINPFMPISGLTDIYYNRIYDIGNRAINRQTVKLPHEITELSAIPFDSFVGRIQSHSVEQTSGMLSLWATLQNIIGMTEELNQGIAINSVTIVEKFTASAFKAATEVLGNCIISFLAEYGI